MIKKYVLYFYNNKIIRYLFFGGLTTLINLFSFYILRTYMILEVNLANIISIIIALIFAYIVNSRFVFKANVSNIKEKLFEIIRFVLARLSTMIVEIVGVFILIEVFKYNDMVSKFFIQFIVITLNYILSKLIVFKTTSENIKI